jgi:peptide/nickel transport system substrate-binding protein
VKRLVTSLALSYLTALLLFIVAGGSLLRAQAPAQDAAPGKVTDDLLRAVPFDRITLNDGTVVIVDPITPRPLPTYDAVKEREKKRHREANEIPPEGNIIIGVPTKLDVPGK